MPLFAIPAILGATIAAGGAIAGGALSEAGAGAQAGAAESAAQLQADEAAKALAFQKQEWQTQQANEAPFLATGTQATEELAGLTKTPGEGLLTPWTDTFVPPTGADAAATPGYQFIKQQGLEALQNSAAASGGLLTTGTAKGLDQFTTGLADSTYQQTYQNALQRYQMAYQQFQNNQTNTFNRLATLSGEGQTTASTLGAEGSAAAGNVANISLTAGGQQGQSIQNAAAATASGYTGVGNALTGGLGNITGLLTLQQLLAQNNKTSTDTGAWG